MGNEASTQGDLQQQLQLLQATHGADGIVHALRPGFQQPNGMQAAPGLGTSTARQPGASSSKHNQAGGGAASESEHELLGQLVALLHRRPRCFLLLSDLGALLPAQLRSAVKEKGGLRSWLQKYPSLFTVSGHPGKESVTLIFGNPDAIAGGADQADASGTGGAGQNADAAQAKEDDDAETASTVQMRGLPYRATVENVKVFLGKHTAFLKDDDAVQLVLNRDGRSSGFARVQFSTPEAATAARDQLHNAVMKTSPDASGAIQERYVEIFLYAERPNKLRFRKGLAGTGGSAQDEIDNVTQEQVIQECREHMACPGKCQLLLSMLGVALSMSSRVFLKRTDLGLKHFLNQYPLEFRVEGVKGREMITYIPAMNSSQAPDSAMLQHVQAHSKQLNQLVNAEPVEGADRRTKRPAKATPCPGPATGNLNEHVLAKLAKEMQPSPLGIDDPMLRSPAILSPGGQALRNLRTPSDWGTPLPDSGYIIPELGQNARNAQPGAAQESQPPAAQVNFVGGTSGNGFVAAPGWAAWGMNPPGIPPAAPFSAGPPLGVAGVPTPWGPPTGPPSNPMPPWAHPGSLTQPAAVPLNPGLPAMIPQPASVSMPPKEKITINGDQVDPGCVLHLRGLPFTCSEQEVYAFFSKHDVVEQIADVQKAVSFLLKSDGRPTVQGATVQMRSRPDAAVAKQALHGQWIGSRFIEVRVLSEDSDKVKVDAGGCRPLEDSSTPAAGDTGGSGSPPHGTFALSNCPPWQQTPSPTPWGVRDMNTLYTMKQMQAQQYTMAAGRPLPVDSRVVGQNADGGASWDALFDFLKREGGPEVAGSAQANA